MTDDKIFGLRFQSNEDLHPTQEELEKFLESPKPDYGNGKHGDDLARYLRDLAAVDEFESHAKRGTAEAGFNERKLFGVLSHSHFFNHALKLAIEQYLYHYGRLRLLDFRKPQAFVKAAQDEINSLSPKKKLDQPKIARLQAMVDQRNQDLETLEKKRLELTNELKNIALYLGDNLARVRKLCESSIAVLVNLQLGKEKETELIEDVKKQFKEEIRDQMQVGPVSREFAEKLKEDFSHISHQLSQLVLEDIYSVTLVYEQIHDHAKKYSAELGALAGRIEAKKGGRFEEDRDVLGRIEQDLVALVTEYRFEPKKTPEILHKDEHERLLADKRKEMINHLFDFLQSHVGG